MFAIGRTRWGVGEKGISMEEERTERYQNLIKQRGKRRLTIHPHKLGIGRGRCQGDSESGTKGGLKQEDGHDE